MTKDLISALINAAEKAANIARKCRADANLLALLVQEKTADEANPRFVQDFKTLADVLIQETVRHDVGKLFPELADNIKGEESASFTNGLGETITVTIGTCVEHTAANLEKVLDGNATAAMLLAEEVHKDIDFHPADLGEVPVLSEDFDLSQVGIWIDPIDGTAEYIQGDTVFSSFPGITSTGLDCVTVLIGAYNTETGLPIIGVVNQPFHNKVSINAYESNLFWGACTGHIRANNLHLKLKGTNTTKVALFSSSENPDLLGKVKELGCEMAFAAGAGHKALKVITEEADLYLLSKASTYKWDTCAPQAILISMHGGIFDFRKSLQAGGPVPLTYNKADGKCNSGGLLAVRDEDMVAPIMVKLK